MRRRSQLLAFKANSRATAAIEFVFVLPIILSIFAGIIEFGRAWQVYGAVNRLASRYAVAWADCSDHPTGACSTELSLYTPTAAMQNLAPQLTNAITVRMIEVTMNGGTPTVVYASPTGTTLTATELAAAQATIGTGQTGVVITVSYVHTLVFFQTMMAPFLGSSRSISYTIAQLKS